MKRTLTVFLVTVVLNAYAQSTTVFHDARWFDPHNGNTWYRQPKMQPSAVTISPDSMIVQLGEQVMRYRILSATPSPKKGSLEYLVTDGAKEERVQLFRMSEPNHPTRQKIAYIGATDWVMMVPLKSIDPPGYYFPGDEKIDVAAFAASLPGYYKFKYLLKRTRSAINRVSKHASLEDNEHQITKCQEDIQIEFKADNTGTWWSGQQEEGCRPEQSAFTWQLKEAVVNGERQLHILIKHDGEVNTFQVVDQEKDRLDLKGEFNLGDDTTLEGVLDMARAKKK